MLNLKNQRIDTLADEATVNEIASKIINSFHMINDNFSETVLVSNVNLSDCLANP